MRKVDLTVIYCSTTREDRCFTEYGLDTCHRHRGFNDPGYHFYIRKDGCIVSTRPIERVGAYVHGFNARSIGIYYEGGLDHERHPEDTRTPEQRHSMQVLVRTLLTDYPDCRVYGYRGLSTDPSDNGEIELEEWIKAYPRFEVLLREVFG